MLSELANAELMLPSELLELTLSRPEVSDTTSARDIRRYLLAWYIVLDVMEAVDEAKKVVLPLFTSMVSTPPSYRTVDALTTLV